MPFRLFLRGGNKVSPIDLEICGQIKTDTNSFQVPTHDPQGVEIPQWKREMMSKKAAEKGKKEAIQRKKSEEEDMKRASMPEWKKQLIEKKMEDPKR